MPPLQCQPEYAMAVPMAKAAPSVLQLPKMMAMKPVKSLLGK